MPATTNIAILGTGTLARQLIKKIYDDAYHTLIFVADVYNQYATAEDMAKDLAYHLKFDTIYGRWNHSVNYDDADYITIDGKKFYCYVDQIDMLPCGQEDVDVVIDASGIPDNGYVYNGVHSSGGRCTIATVTPESNALQNLYSNRRIVTPLNDIAHGYSAYLCNGDIVVRSIIAKAINNNATISYANFVINKSNTNYEYVQDYPDGNASRNSRSCDNIVFENTYTDSSMGWIIPELNGKISYSTYRVTNKNNNSIFATFMISQSVDESDVEYFLKNLTSKYLELSETDTVSSDFTGQRVAGIDTTLISVRNLGQVIHFNAYYDHITIQVYNIMDYIDNHSGDWTYNG